MQKWGNSLAVRIPNPFANEIGLEQDSPVEVSMLDGKLVLLPIHETAWSLDQLLEMVTEDNMHNEVNSGPVMGNEVW